jgi:UDP-N-acetylglucosamine 2-epimerase (non-hydrolysing)/GDP/UDP-N,N'-diacetylbacillosamine 2-epimerase (hydrolysing)
MKRKILFVTERRADYSRLKPIMRLVQKSPRLSLQLVVTGNHLLKSFGETKRVIERDGFRIDTTLPVFTSKDKDDGAMMARAFGHYVLKLTGAIERLKPDVVFCGFDLDAHLAAAVVGMHLNIPVAHIQGGERSGTIDEVLRHATTKFSHLHFVATKESRERVIKLGENPRYVFCVGSPSLNTIHSISYPPRTAVFRRYGLNPKKPLIIFSQHPVTTEADDVERQIGESIAAVRNIARFVGAEVLAIYSNNDAGGKRIVARLKRSGFNVFPHIAYEDYLRLMKHAHVMVGNSSAAIHEAPSFGLPAVSVGTRQQHRERGRNVIEVPNRRVAIERALIRAMTDAKLRGTIKRAKNPYDHGDTARKIVTILETIPLPPVQKVLRY